jgi:hypothetical protein
MKNPPAFPRPFSVDETTSSFPSSQLYPAYSGMLLRDYFAAKAMQSILARADNRFTTTLDFVGGKAYQYADAMMKAREA